MQKKPTKHNKDNRQNAPVSKYIKVIAKKYGKTLEYLATR